MTQLHASEATTQNPPRMMPIGHRDAQTIELNPVNECIYVGGRKAEHISEAIQRRAKLRYTFTNLGVIDPKHLAPAVAKRHLPLNAIGDIKEKDKFLNLLMHEIKKVRPSGRGDDSHQENEALNAILDEARRLCNGHT